MYFFVCLFQVEGVGEVSGGAEGEEIEGRFQGPWGRGIPWRPGGVGTEEEEGASVGGAVGGAGSGGGGFRGGSS